MKNAINYFYDLIPNNIHQNKDEYYFEVDNKKYILQECNRSREELYEIYDLEFFLYQYKIYLHQIILNKSNEIISLINNKNYILMQAYINEDRKISINDLKIFSNIKIFNNYISIKRNNWRELWIRKIDYIEYQIDQNKNKYRNFSNSIDYFIGLVENAIQLLNELNNKDLYVAHQRITTNMRVKDLYNPLNIIIDTKVRDINEYYKNILFKKENIEQEIFEYFNYANLTKNEYLLFYIRFLFITRYFDLFDKVLLDDSNDNIDQEINIIINYLNEYEIILKKIYEYLYNLNILPEIEWLKKTSI